MDGNAFPPIPVHDYMQNMEKPDPTEEAIIGLEQHAHMLRNILDKVYLYPSEEFFMSRSVIRAITDYCDQLLAIYENSKEHPQ